MLNALPVIFWTVWTALWVTIAVNTAPRTEGDLFQRQLATFLGVIGACLFVVAVRRTRP